MPHFIVTSTKSSFLPMVLFIIAGCATVPYEFGHAIEKENTLKLKEGEPQIERGKPCELVDGLGHYVVSLPSKLILWSWRVDNHNISKRTEQRLRQYLAENDLHHVKVRLNQYAPIAEWKRLFRNKSVGAGWRYTFGVISMLFYTLLPERFFGGDNYNPYTNTINLYSDHKSIALHEAAHAKDFAKREWKGTYAAIGILPLVPLYHEYIASADVISYHRAKGLPRDEKADYKILYPAYCTYIAGEVLEWLPLEYWVRYAITAVATIPGHIAGRIKASRVKEAPSTTSAAGAEKEEIVTELSPNPTQSHSTATYTWRTPNPVFSRF